MDINTRIGMNVHFLQYLSTNVCSLFIVALKSSLLIRHNRRGENYTSPVVSYQAAKNE